MLWKHLRPNNRLKNCWVIVKLSISLSQNRIQSSILSFSSITVEHYCQTLQTRWNKNTTNLSCLRHVHNPNNNNTISSSSRGNGCHLSSKGNSKRQHKSFTYSLIDNWTLLWIHIHWFKIVTHLNYSQWPRREIRAVWPTMQWSKVLSRWSHSISWLLMRVVSLNRDKRVILKILNLWRAVKIEWIWFLAYPPNWLIDNYLIDPLI